MPATRCSRRSTRPCARSRCRPGANAILSDTVGFITDLPTSLVAAFRATLEEVLSADLIVHVRDISHPDTEAQKRDVEKVLAELGIGAERSRRADGRGVEQDRSADPGGAGRAAGRRPAAAPASTCSRRRTGMGLRPCWSRRTGGSRRAAPWSSSTSTTTRARSLAWLHRHGEVLEQHRRRCRPSSQGCDRRTRARPARPQARPAGLARSRYASPTAPVNARKSRLRKTAACEWGRKRLKSGVVGGTPETQPHSALRLICCQRQFLKSR